MLHLQLPSRLHDSHPKKVLEAVAIKLNFSFNLKCLLIAVQSEKFPLAETCLLSFWRTTEIWSSFLSPVFFFFLRVWLLCSLSTKSNFMIYFQFISSTQTTTTFCLNLALRMCTHAQLTSHTNCWGKSVSTFWTWERHTTAPNCLWKCKFIRSSQIITVNVKHNI